MRLLLKNLNLINPAQNLNEVADLLIEDGIIIKIGSIDEADEKGNRIIDLKNCYAAPGFLDMHVHLREPGREDKETVVSGCNSAAAGGFTAVACMPNTSPTLDSAEVVTFIKNKAKDYLVDVYPIAAATLDRKGEALSPMQELFEAGAVGFSDDGVAIKTAGILKSVLEYAKMFDAPVIEHCEDESLADGAMNESETSTQLGLPPLPSVAEDLIVMRDILMAEYTGGRVHIAHMSTKRSVELVRDAKERGVKVTSEVTPHHFTLTDESLKGYNTNLKMNPPLRGNEDVEAMIEGLKDGTVDCIASDHAPHTIEEKEQEFIYAPNGILGLETQVGISLSELYHKKHLSLDEVINKMSANPRKILNLDPIEIKEGEVANLTIFDPEKIWTVNVKDFKSKSINSPFDKKLLTGKAIATINNKKMFIDNQFEEL